MVIAMPYNGLCGVVARLLSHVKDWSIRDLLTMPFNDDYVYRHRASALASYTRYEMSSFMDIYHAIDLTTPLPDSAYP
jgi:hypothetical protein